MADVQLSYGGNTCDLSLPSSSETTITLPFDFIKLDDNTLDVYDNGAQYDKRLCKCTMLLSTTEQTNLNTFLNSTARAKTVDMILTAGSGWFPFGPDKGDEGTFSVSITISGTPKIKDNPFRYFECNLIINAISYPGYSLPSETYDGPTFRIGAVDYLAMPQSLFEPDQIYTISVAFTESNRAEYFDRGSLGDAAGTSFTLQCNESKCAALLYYLTTTKRTELFEMETGSYYYAFGPDHNSSNTYNVLLASEKIIVKQIRHDYYEVKLDLKYDSDIW